MDMWHTIQQSIKYSLQPSLEMKAIITLFSLLSSFYNYMYYKSLYATVVTTYAQAATCVKWFLKVLPLPSVDGQ
jgi:hypothetical protein